MMGGIYVIYGIYGILSIWDIYDLSGYTQTDMNSNAMIVIYLNPSKSIQVKLCLPADVSIKCLGGY